MSPFIFLRQKKVKYYPAVITVIVNSSSKVAHVKNKFFLPKETTFTKGATFYALGGYHNSIFSECDLQPSTPSMPIQVK